MNEKAKDSAERADQPSLLGILEDFARHIRDLNNRLDIFECSDTGYSPDARRLDNALDATDRSLKEMKAHFVNTLNRLEMLPPCRNPSPAQDEPKG